MTPDKVPSADQKLARIIEAQVKNGQAAYKPCAEWYHLSGPILFASGTLSKEERADLRPIHILEIILDPAGLRSAYGEHDGTVAYRDGVVTDARWKAVAQHILWTWLSTEGDPDATIVAAYLLLP